MILLLGSNAQPLSLTVDPTETYGSRSGVGTCNSSFVYTTVNGGVPGYTYLWTHISGDVLTISNSTSKDTRFSSSLSTNQVTNSVYRCTVTDSASHTATVDVSILLQEISFG